MGAPVVEVADTMVLLLACGVPDLKPDGGYFQVERLCEEGACKQDAGCMFTCSKGRELQSTAVRSNPSQGLVTML